MVGVPRMTGILAENALGRPERREPDVHHSRASLLSRPSSRWNPVAPPVHRPALLMECGSRRIQGVVQLWDWMHAQVVLANIGWHHWVKSGNFVHQHPGTDAVQDGPAQVLCAQPLGEGVLIPVFVGRGSSRFLIYWEGAPGAWGGAGLIPADSVGAWPPFIPKPPRGFKAFFFLSSCSLSCQ